MALFQVIPEDFFSILASRNRHLYVEALEVLWSLYQERMKISRKLYVEHLMESLDSKEQGDIFEDEEMHQEEKENIRGKASFLVRKLKEKGWIEEELSPDYEIYYTVPDYSSRLLNLFYDLQSAETHRGFSYVYGSYSVLKTADSEKDPTGQMQALTIAWDNTQELIKLLKKIYHNMKRYIKSHSDLESSNDVIAMYYDDFMNNVAKKYIEPLKLRESIPKYRNSIQSILMSWLEDEEVFGKIVQAQMAESQSKDYQDCASQVQAKIHWIHKQYNLLETDLMEDINQQLTRYTRSATQKIKHLSNRDQNTKGALSALLQTMGQGADTSLVEDIQGLFQLQPHKFYDVKSLYQRRNPVARSIQEPLTVEEVPPSSQAVEEMEALLYRPYGKRAVLQFMLELFGDSEKIYSKDFPLSQKKGYIMSFLALLYQDDKQCFYTVEMLEGFYEQGSYTIPQMVFRRKDGTHG